MPQSHTFTPADLPVTATKRIYHLDLAPGELAANIIIVGDPERVPLIADAHLSDRETDRDHRGLRTITGYAGETGQRISVVTSGMGTPSLEIVLQEIVALHEIDFATRSKSTKSSPINIIRVGTSGGLQESTDLGTPIVSSYAIGLDNTGLFYDAPAHDDHCSRIESEIQTLLTEHASPEARFRSKISPYVSRADDFLVNQLLIGAEETNITVKCGITVSSSGFYANQGRDVAGVPPTVPAIDAVLGSYDPGVSDLQIENMEMETSFLLHFMNSLGHRAASICPAIANRQRNTFARAEDIKSAVQLSTELAIKALHAAEKQN